MYKYNVGELSTNDANIAQEWIDITQEQNRRQKEWVESLKKAGYKMAMPNDGWINREQKTFSVAYPHFMNGDLNIGDKVMLGWADENLSRLSVKITGIKKEMLGSNTYYYEVQPF